MFVFIRKKYLRIGVEDINRNIFVIVKVIVYYEKVNDDNLDE